MQHDTGLLISTLDVGVKPLCSDAIEQEKITSKKKAVNVSPQKNYRPPRPIGVKGGCSPQNNRRKLSSL
jgi:hypothetical protein